MAQDLANSLRRLMSLRSAVVEAEKRGSVGPWLLEELATLAPQLEQSGASSFTVAEARGLFNRAARMPIKK